MPVLAANYSRELVSLLENEADIVDAVKVSEFYSEEYIAMYRSLPVRKPFVLHGVCQDTRRSRGLSLGMPGFEESLDLASLRTALDLCKPAYISAHLEFHAFEHPNAQEFLASLESDALLIRTLTKLPLHLENTYFDFPRPGKVANARYICDPKFIREALGRTGARMLLDVAHAQAAAWHLGVPASGYMLSLPLSLVDEIHVNSPEMADGELRDRHVELDEEGYELTELVLEHADVKTISLEYGGVGPVYENRSDISALRRQLVRLRKMMGR